MNKVFLTRGASSSQGTFGILTFGSLKCYTTELPWRNNLSQKSCIPVGEYICALVKSPKFGKVYGVQNVQGRSNVLIHPANLGGNVDEGWSTELHGCIAPSLKQGTMLTPNGRMQKAGLLSRPAVRALMDWAQDKPFILVIK